MWRQCDPWDERFTRRKKEIHTKWAKAQCERPRWLTEQEVAIASRAMTPPDFQSDFCMVWLTYLFHAEKKPDRVERDFHKKKKKNLTLWFLYSMTETLYLQGEGSISLPNKPDFIQEADTFSLGSNKVMSETIRVLSCLKINMCLSVLLY